MLQEIEARPRPPRRPHVDKVGGCDPSADAALSYAATHLVPTADHKPIVLVDLQYANRVLPYLGPSSLIEVQTRSAIVHRAYHWESHFRWASCKNTAFD